WLKRLKKAGEFAFDTETTSLNAMEAELVGLSFSIRPGEAAYVPVAHDYPGAPVQLSAGDVLAKIKPLLESRKIGKIGQNLKYDKEVLANYALDLNAIRYDTMLESYVLDSSGSRHDMDTLALKYLGYKTVHFDEVAGKGKKQIGFNQVDLEQAGPYAAEDADIALRLHQTLWPRLQREPGPKKVFTDIEMPLVPVLARVERNGVKIDADMLRQQSRELEQRMAEIEKQARELAGEPFNMSSPKQIQHILFEKMGLPVLRKTPKGQPSTAESALQDLALDYDLPRLILQQRALAKLKSTYTDKLPKMINPKTGRVHTSYHQAVAATGRLSSSDPNLQNIPVRTEEGRRIRKAFIAEDGHKLVAADYSQVELRIMAHLSQDEGLLKAFEHGIDVHAATASEVFGVPLDQVTSDQRRHAKAINFGLIYGMSAFGLAQQLGIDRAAAQNYIDRYFARYPGVKRYMEQTRELARRQGYVETVFGRRLYLPEINSRNYQRRQYAERTAINAPMQGTAADLIKMAMIEADRWLTSGETGARMIMQVHDELVLEVADRQTDEVIGKISDIMTGVGKGHLSVPLEVEAAAGENWEEAHP
ncbi:MAG: DNA polymerase I, partial [Gammaproteobacteria bacterium]